MREVALDGTLSSLPSRTLLTVPFCARFFHPSHPSLPFFLPCFGVQNGEKGEDVICPLSNRPETASARHTIFTRFNVPHRFIVPRPPEPEHVPPHLYPLPCPTFTFIDLLWRGERGGRQQ